jgi:hypothetical protein
MVFNDTKPKQKIPFSKNKSNILWDKKKYERKISCMDSLFNIPK